MPYEGYKKGLDSYTAIEEFRYGGDNEDRWRDDEGEEWGSDAQEKEDRNVKQVRKGFKETVKTFKNKKEAKEWLQKYIVRKLKFNGKYYNGGELPVIQIHQKWKGKEKYITLDTSKITKKKGNKKILYINAKNKYVQIHKLIRDGRIGSDTIVEVREFKRIKQGRKYVEFMTDKKIETFSAKDLINHQREYLRHVKHIQKIERRREQKRKRNEYKNITSDQIKQSIDTLQNLKLDPIASTTLNIDKTIKKLTKELKDRKNNPNYKTYKVKIPDIKPFDILNPHENLNESEDQ